MSREISNDETGETEVVYTAQEIEEAKQGEATRISAEKDIEIAKLRQVSAEKTENFRKYNEMTEEEKKAHSENEIIQIRRNDKLEEELSGVKSALEQKEVKERDYAKTSALKGFHGDKEDVKKTLEDKYAMLSGMPETTADEIKARASAAATLAGISVNSINPLYQGFSGEAPQYKEKGTDFTDSPEGKAALNVAREAVGLPVDNK